jgi:hypothetical protein
MNIRQSYLIEVLSLMPKNSKWFIKINEENFISKIRNLIEYEEGVYYVIDLAKNDSTKIIKSITKFDLQDRIEEGHILSLENKLFESYDYFEFGLISKTVNLSSKFTSIYIESEEMCKVSEEW